MLGRIGNPFLLTVHLLNLMLQASNGATDTTVAEKGEGNCRAKHELLAMYRQRNQSGMIDVQVVHKFIAKDRCAHAHMSD